MALAPSSPRLPSPPPTAEIQIGPKSPAGAGTKASRQAQHMEQNTAEANAKRRIHPGTKAEEMAAGPPLVPLNELDSAFQLQEHLAALHYHHTAQGTQPISRQTAMQLATPPSGIDRTLWLYELCRFLIAQCNSLIVGFLFDKPPCSQATCPEMRASEWQFLCAVHDQPKSCCAIDYCCHTLDWAANVVTNPKIFPSRFVGPEGHDKNAVQKNLVNVFRRLHRIFAHAWFQHRGVFWSVEAQTGLYVFFKTVCDLYDLLPQENYKLPPEAEGLEPAAPGKDENQPKVMAIAKPPPRDSESVGHDEDDDRHSRVAKRSNTARHSSRPSTGYSVTTVIEEREDESADISNKMKDVQISMPGKAEEESEVEVPVMVQGEVLDDKSSNSPTEAPQPPEHLEGPRGVVVDVQEDVPEEPIQEGGAKDTDMDAPLFEHEKITEPKEEEKPVGFENNTKHDENVQQIDKPAESTSVADFASDGAAEEKENIKDPSVTNQEPSKAGEKEEPSDAAS